MPIVPNFDQIQAFATAPDTGPVAMLNLLKFKPRADAGSGVEEYNRCGDPVTKMIESRKAFIEMVGSDDYQDAHRHREGGRERSVVLACVPTLDRTLEARA